MAKILDLPVELHTQILKLLYHSMQGASSTLPGGDQFNRNRTTTNRNNNSGPGLHTVGPGAVAFPFNVSTTCKLWRTILSTIPECWTQVNFDTGVSPTPFLDAFSFSGDRKITDFNIFFQSWIQPYDSESEEHNDDGDSEEEEEILEAARVSSIFDALLPHLHRCTGSILISTKYLSSQPPPVTFFMDRIGALKMQEFTQLCQLDVVEDLHTTTGATIPLSDPVSDRSLDCCKPGAGRPFLGSSLKTITLTAYWFIHMLVHVHTAPMFRMRSLPSRKYGFRKFHIDGYIFDEDRGLFILETLAEGLSEILTSELCLSNLVVPEDAAIPRRPGLRRQRRLKIDPGSIDFSRVSPEIIQLLDDIAEICPRWILTFKWCVIPSKLHKNDTPVLFLYNIDDDSDIENQTIASTWIGRLETHNSIASALHWWNGTEFSVIDCFSFTDDVILDMQRPLPDGKLPASSLQILSIINCQDFTPRALMRLIQSRPNPFLYPSPEVRPRMLDMLVVLGRCPALTEDDMEWFRINTDMRVCWKVHGMPNDTPFILESRSGRPLANGYLSVWPDIINA